MNQLIEKAFKSLAVTCNMSALHPSDEDRIKITLRTLNKNGVEIDVASLEEWLLKNNWQEKPVKNIVSWAKAVSTCHRQCKNDPLVPV